jgi:hypothetical protein
MVKVIIDSAENGIIKTIKDDNINGAGTKLESKKVYNFKDDDLHSKKIQFFYELAEDLGIDIGNIYKNNNLIMTTHWGLSYHPTKEEFKTHLDILKLDVAGLEYQYKQYK